MKFLFWNVNGKVLDDLVADLAQVHNVDLIMLAECPGDPFALLDRLNRDEEFQFHNAPTLSKTIKLLGRFPPEYLRPRIESSRMTIQALSLPARLDLIVVVVHFPTKLFWSDDSQALECVRLANAVRQVESDSGHTRTVLIGDLNMNPFEKGVVGAIGLNATMTRRTATRKSRTVQAAEYPFFYNPMWNRFGDEQNMVPGTYYYDCGEHVNYYWNVFDQVLVRPALLEQLPANPVQVITRTTSRSLLNSGGTPDSAIASDHLPLIFSLNL